jgi:periplasmic divalent cation tolerance protein
MTDATILAISSTFASRAKAEACGRRLVEAGVAACAQVDGPVSSIYRWRHAIDVAEEWRMTCKTAPVLEAACVAALLAAHDYELPQVTIAHLSASPAYAAWVRGGVAGV